MHRLTIAFTLLLCCGIVAAQPHATQHSSQTASLMPGLGDLHHPVTTSNPEAQKFFDQGLRLIYAFNHDEAARSFRHAAELDPKMAMAYWGIAEAQRQLKDFANAKVNYEKVAEFDPDSKHGKQAKKLLKDPEIANAHAVSNSQ